MAFNGPVLLKRIPDDPGQRKLFKYADYVGTGGYASLKKAQGMAPGDVTKMVQESGLRGRGGAGFPCGVKWTFLPKDVHPRYLAVNFDESEPATFKDRYLCDYDPHVILEGIAIAAYANSITNSYIFIRGEYHREAVIIEEAVREAYANGIFGVKHPGTEIVHNCYVHRGAGAYICGEETGLLEALEGKRGWPRIKPPFPAVAGAFAKPTIINNVETLACLPFIVENGAAAFKAMGTATSAGPKLMGVSGHVNKPGCYEEELGIPMGKLVEKYAGGVKGKYKSAFHGGISMGVLGTDQWDAPLDFDIGKKYNVLGLGTACVTIMNDTVDMVKVARNCVRFYSHESCGQCTPCREGSAWMAKMLNRMVAGRGRARDLDMLMELALAQGSMPGTTICGLADGTNWVMKTILQKFPEDFKRAIKSESVQGVEVT
ncbi:MAG TPA: NADH-quinone oxidoreductase subunit NuoF, partial [Phycisphaerae bacterium]|nr:NADH-quinone oxidoreductase subunit NuoF [Phycisphaerae bacterium]